MAAKGRTVILMAMRIRAALIGLKELLIIATEKGHDAGREVGGVRGTWQKMDMVNAHCIKCGTFKVYFLKKHPDYVA